MSIIEKAMNKLGSARLQRRTPATESPTLLKHPAVDEIQHGVDRPARDGTSSYPISDERHARGVRIARLKSGDLFASPELAPQVAEEFRRIKRPLLANAFGKGASHLERGNLIMVTSSLPGEGKTFMSINLSLSVALERNHTVLLVDADVAKRNVSRLYGLEEMPGLIDILSDGHLALSQVHVHTDVSDLAIVPTGRRHPQAAELLASNEMKRLVTELADRDPERVIIFDSPPLLATSEARVLADLTSQIVLVVEADRTPQQVVKEAIAALDTSKAINLVLNKSRHSGGYDGYGKYGYGSK